MNLENIKNKTVQMILQFSIPSIIAMVLTSLITIVDGFFIGNYVGKEGIAAVNLGLPIVYVYLGFGIMFGVGGIAIAGIALGAQDIKKSNNVFNQTVISSIIVSVILSIFICIFMGSIIRAVNIDAQVGIYFDKYYSIMILAYPIMIVNSTLGMFIRGEGKPHLFMLINILTVISNICLDYYFIKILRFGIKGIALASLISLIIGLFSMILFFLKKSSIYKIRKFQFSKQVLRDTVLNGSSEFIGQMSMSISMFAYNWVIMKNVGVEGVAAFTIVGYIAYLFSMVIVGFGQGASPLISFSYGAKEFELSKTIRKITNIFVFLSGVVVMIILFIASDWYSNAFVRSESVVALIRSGLSIFMFSFLFSGINTITSFYFTSIGKAKESAIISLSRGLVVLLICIFTLPTLFGMTGVWLVAPVTEAITIVLSIMFIRVNEK
ncbi:MATE family efflux transporter [Anaerosacchariphilus polymeriproducens]|uniref:Multidrug export protein MepA n=1 Tax=Anaerosacchariphilus polymeriproducens TaxID=1812858 RepID=A0A371AXT2_9FIRM|nr:MATE family efflux transporter [Anaerosacchariphilus polymeriproducens]RDU24367.1 MATE family efflux transporter [Anaerosacchariphilus polymeriproducens]